MYYYSKEEDLVCRLVNGGQAMNFGKEDFPIVFDDNGITTHKFGFTYHFYPSINSPRLGGEDPIHLYPIDEEQVSLSEGSYIFQESADIQKILKEAYIMLRRAMVEEDHLPDGTLNREGFDWNINDAHTLSKKILLHLDRNDNQVEQNRQKIEEWSGN